MKDLIESNRDGYIAGKSDMLLSQSCYLKKMVKLFIVFDVKTVNTLLGHNTKHLVM